MTNDERHMPTQDHHDKYRGAMARTILQGLILAGILGVVRMLWLQNEATGAQNVALGQLQVQVSALQSSLSGLPDLSNRVMRLETNQAELMRRQGNDEAWRDRMQADPKLKGWTR